MSIDKAYIKTLSRESLLTLISLCVEVLQEENAEEWVPTEKEKADIARIRDEIQSGKVNLIPGEEFKKELFSRI
jgi:hypothetical protein